MKVSRRLTLKYLKSNIFRTLITIFGLALSISMIVFTLISIVSLNKGMLFSAIEEIGFQDFTIERADKGIYDKVLLTKNISKLVKVNDEKIAAKYYPSLNGDESITNIQIKEVEAGYFKHFFKYDIVEGRLPLNSGEALVPYDLKGIIPNFSKRDVEIALNTVNSKDYEEFSKEFKFFDGDLSQKSIKAISEIRKVGLEDYIKKNYYSSSENYGLEKFKIVGYYSVNSISYGIQNKPEFSSLEGEFDYFNGQILKLSEIRDNDFNIEGIFSRPELINETISDIESIVRESDSRAKLYLNDNILDLKYPRGGASYFYLLISFFVVIVLLYSVSAFIYNIFTTNFTEKERAFGLLRVVGLTDSQLRKMIIREANIYLSFAFPLGCVLGLIGSRRVFSYLEKIFSDTIFGINSQVFYHTNWLVFFVSFVLSVIMVYFNIIASSRRVFNTNPIKMVNNIFDQLGKVKIKNSQKLIKKIFGYELFLSMRNVTRNKRRLSITTSTITLSIVIFVLSGFITKTFDIQVSKRIREDAGSYGIMTSSNRRITNSFIQDISKIEGIKSLHNLSYTPVSLYDEKEELKNRSNILIILKDKEFESIFPEYRDISYNLVLSDGPVSDGKFTYSRISIFPKILEENYFDDGSDFESDTNKKNLFEVKTISSNKPEIMSYMESIENFDNILLTRESSFLRIYNKGYLVKDIIELDKDDNIMLDKNRVKSVLLKYPTIKLDSYDIPIIKILKLYANGFVSVIVAIAVLNVINTTYNNIMVKRREIALVKALGLEEKRTRLMVISEPIISVVIAGFLSFIVLFVMIFLLYKLQMTQMGGKMVNITYPLTLFLISLALNFLLVYTTSIYLYKKFKNENLMGELKTI